MLTLHDSYLKFSKLHILWHKVIHMFGSLREKLAALTLVIISETSLLATILRLGTYMIDILVMKLWLAN